ncbi:hypothetical protein LOK46_10545 [Methylobacterium sp. NMS14P]|uniref:DUF6889 family protein n=1 Tax=Methylobacterium sp. NMS14P TaxID=2894310 RepID=UPI00235820CE|nr:hypothetical protein [Methylobacterium sp. NMS14P]WCS27228.1 hypothetical protein LOK46_10545 [Methylobacterium sp. NMS14P]
MRAAQPRPFAFCGETYRAARLSAWDQWESLRVLRPALEDGQKRARAQRGAATDDLTTAFADAVKDIAPETLSALFDLALTGVERREGGDWQPVWDAAEGVPLFDDLGAGRVVLLVVRILGDNLHGYFSYTPVSFDRIEEGPSYDPVLMPDGQSWLFAPMQHKHCLYSELFDGTLDLRDVARMNDLIAVSNENRSRARKAAQDEAARQTT